MTALPDPNLRDIQLNRLSRYQHLQQIIQHFWQHWSKEYISELQQRSKWKTAQMNIKIGELVLLKEDNLPPNRWKLGRIQEVHPGRDNIVRVISIKTNNGVLKRAINKVCPLPT